MVGTDWSDKKTLFVKNSFLDTYKTVADKFQSWAWSCGVSIKYQGTNHISYLLPLPLRTNQSLELKDFFFVLF